MIVEMIEMDLHELVLTLVAAAKGGDYSLAVSVGIMVLVFLATKVPFIKNWLPKSMRPWVAAVAGVLGAVAATAATTGDWLMAVINGAVVGTAATGLWELIGKKVFGSTPEPSDSE